jgi:hypothetical protein
MGLGHGHGSFDGRRHQFRYRLRQSRVGSGADDDGSRDTLVPGVMDTELSATE